MAIDIKPILNLGLAAQSLAVSGENISLAKKKKRTVEDIISTGVKTVVGIGFIKKEAQIIGKL